MIKKSQANNNLYNYFKTTSLLTNKLNLYIFRKNLKKY